MATKQNLVAGADADVDLTAALLAGENGEGEKIRIGIDDMLQQYVGEFGRWQMRHFLLTSAAWALEAFHTMVMIFADREIGGGCQPERSGASTVAEWGLVCGEKYKVGLVQSLFFAGCMIGVGALATSPIPSSAGKDPQHSLILNTIFGLLTSLSPSY